MPDRSRSSRRRAPSLRGALPERDASLLEAVTPHVDRLLGVAERILGCPDQARDAVQEAMITLWRLGEIPENARGWLVRTVVHRSLHARRTDERRRKWEQRAGSETAALCPFCDPARELEAQELRQAFESALTELSTEQREILALREIDGLEYAEIAERLALPIGTVRSRLNRARAALRVRVEASA